MFNKKQKKEQSLEQIKKEISKLKQLKEKKLKKSKVNQEKEKLLQELNELKGGTKSDKFIKIAGKTLQGVDKDIKVGFKALGNFADRVEYANTNLNLGDKVKISRGNYKNKILTITKFIPGGVQGVISSGELLNIRHNGYIK